MQRSFLYKRDLYIGLFCTCIGLFCSDARYGSALRPGHVQTHTQTERSLRPLLTESCTILLLFVFLLSQHDSNLLGLFGQKSTVYIRLFRKSPVYIGLLRKIVSQKCLVASSSSLSSAPSASFCVVGSLLANEPCSCRAISQQRPPPAPTRWF